MNRQRTEKQVRGAIVLLSIWNYSCNCAKDWICIKNKNMLFPCNYYWTFSGHTGWRQKMSSHGWKRVNTMTGWGKRNQWEILGRQIWIVWRENWEPETGGHAAERQKKKWTLCFIILWALFFCYLFIYLLFAAWQFRWYYLSCWASVLANTFAMSFSCSDLNNSILRSQCSMQYLSSLQ